MNRTILEQKRKPPSRDRKQERRESEESQKATAIYQLLSTPFSAVARRRRPKSGKQRPVLELRAAIATATEAATATVIAFRREKAPGKRRDHHLHPHAAAAPATSSSASSSSSSGFCCCCFAFRGFFFLMYTFVRFVSCRIIYHFSIDPPNSA